MKFKINQICNSIFIEVISQDLCQEKNIARRFFTDFADQNFIKKTV